MLKVNPDYLKLRGSYLFSNIAKKVSEYSKLNPDAEIIRLGIGDVTEPLTPFILKAIHDATDEMGKKETFKGYGPEQGYAFLREAIKDYYSTHNVSLDSNEIFISDGIIFEDGEKISTPQEATGIYYLWIFAEDSEGSIKERSNAFYIDNMPPVVSVSGAYMDWKKSEEVTINISDIDSGLSELNEYKYYLSTSNSEPTGGQWIEYTLNEKGVSTITIGEGLNGIYYLWISPISDNAGNITSETMNFGNYKFDNTAPEIEVEYKEKEDSVEVKLKSNEELQELEGWTLSEDKLELSKIYEEDTEERIVVEDIAGNEQEIEISVKISEEKEIEIASENYTIDLENSEYIKGVEARTNVKDFLDNIETNAGSIVVKDKDGNEIEETALIGTGMTIDFNNGEQVLTIVVIGDINGDGKVTASDVSNLKSAIIGKRTLEGAYKEAGDLKEDGEVKASDLSRLKKMIIGL